MCPQSPPPTHPQVSPCSLGTPRRQGPGAGPPGVVGSQDTRDRLSQRAGSRSLRTGPPGGGAGRGAEGPGAGAVVRAHGRVVRQVAPQAAERGRRLARCHRHGARRLFVAAAPVAHLGDRNAAGAEAGEATPPALCPRCSGRKWGFSRDYQGPTMCWGPPWLRAGGERKGLEETRDPQAHE